MVSKQTLSVQRPDRRPRSNVSAMGHFAFRPPMKAHAIEADVCLGVRGALTEMSYGIEM